MKTHSPVAPRAATIEQDDVRREGRAVTHGPRTRVVAAAAAVLFAVAIGACTPAASTAPNGSLVLPSVNVSAAASVASQAAVAALDQIDAAITANQTSTGLTVDEGTSLKDLATGVRTALQTGDLTAARTAVTDLSTKVDGLAAKISGPAGEQLKAAITALKAALPAS